MPRIELPDVQLNVCLEGSGPPLLLVHGFPLDHTMWAAQIAHFAGTHTVVAPDLRGFGHNDAATGPLPMYHHADDLAELLQRLGVIEPVTLCGLSMGGFIAFEFARRHAARLAALVLCDTRAAVDTAEARPKRYEVAERVLREGTDFLAASLPERLYCEQTRREQPAVVAATREVIRRTPRVSVAAASRGMAERSDATQWLAAIDVPTLVVCGEHDALVTPSEMAEFAGKIPKAQFVVLTAAGHMAPQEQSELFNAALARFLRIA